MGCGFLKSEEEVAAAYEDIVTAARAARPEAKIFGVTVQTQVEKRPWN